MPVKDVIADSRNVAHGQDRRSSWRPTRRGPARLLYDMWKRVGAGGQDGRRHRQRGGRHRPGIRQRYQWAPVDLANRAFGQGVSVTLVQLARGFSTLVNGGFLVQPHVVVDGDAAELRPGERVLRGEGRPPDPGDPRLRHRIGAPLRRGHAHPGLPRSAARPARPRSGTCEKGDCASAPLQPQLHRLRRLRPARTSSSRCASRRPCPTP